VPAVRAAVGLVAAGALVLLGCTESTPDQAETRDWLIDEIGFTEAQATCVVDQVWALDDVDDDDLLSELAEDNPDLEDDDEVRLAEIVRSCIGN
jgi:hypothetical protein